MNWRVEISGPAGVQVKRKENKFSIYSKEQQKFVIKCSNFKLITKSDFVGECWVTSKVTSLNEIVALSINYDNKSDVVYIANHLHYTMYFLTFAVLLIFQLALTLHRGLSSQFDDVWIFIEVDKVRSYFDTSDSPPISRRINQFLWLLISFTMTEFNNKKFR